jgi:phosphomannomutase
MVTASHNPPDDNGYKVYLGGADRGRRSSRPPTPRSPRTSSASPRRRVADMPRADYEVADESVIDAYVAATATVAPRRGRGRHELGLHGDARRGLRDAGAILDSPATRCRSSSRSRSPDGRFPTVAFPNPEEPGAMDLSFATARAAEPSS